MLVLNPKAETSKSHDQVVLYPGDLHGKRVAIVVGDIQDQSHQPFDVFKFVKEMVRDTWRVSEVLDYRKPSLSRVTPKEMFQDILDHRPEFIINGPCA